MKNGERKTYLDIAKGIGMLWIITLHADANWYFSNVGPSVQIPLFFVIAGYLWKEREIPRTLQLRSRALPLLRQYFGYNAGLFLLYLIDLRAYYIPQTRWCLRQILKHLFGVCYAEGVILVSDQTPYLHFLTSYNYATWFLPAMVTASAALLVLLAIRERFHISLWLQTIPCILVTVLLNLLPLRLPWSLCNLFFFAAMMAVGMELRRMDLFERQWKSPLIPAGMWIVGAALFVFLAKWNEGSGTSMLMSYFGGHGKLSVPVFFVGGILGSCVLLGACRVLERLKLSRPLAYLGRNTIPILCLHLSFVVYYNRLWQLLAGIDPAEGSALFYVRSISRLVIAAAGSVGLAALGRHMKKLYLHRRSGRIPDEI